MAQPAPKYPLDLATETPAEREARLAWELERIAEADADMAAGRYITGEELDAFLESELAAVKAAMVREAG
ncbi:hypothetical protein [Brevundimonas sp.]|uniref:hypothetical protein n=1 Tax=Brevundimonas sp. TaxID=1871086 RepID=UPI002EDA4595